MGNASSLIYELIQLFHVSAIGKHFRVQAIKKNKQLTILEGSIQ